MPRDDFSAPVKRLIAEQAGFCCAYPNCLAPTSGPTMDGKDSVSVGVAAHISGAAQGGPRYDSIMSAEHRSSVENGIWLCQTHAALIDRDEDQFTTRLLQEWKDTAENRAMKVIGQPRGCAAGNLATVSPVTRVGAEQSVLVNGAPMPYAAIFDPDEPDFRMTWFVSGFVVQFSIEKNYRRNNVIIDHLIVTVHETREIPRYQPLMGVYPAQVSMYYVEIDPNKGTIPREFVPSRFYSVAADESESQQFPPPIVLDDQVPAHIALRFNAKTSGLYLMSLDAALSCGDERERLSILPAQWAIFEAYEVDED